MPEHENALELAGEQLPTAQTIRAVLRQQLNGAVATERARRGEVVAPEDTWQMHRSLALVAQTCGEYSRAFADAAREAGQVAEEELIDTFGEQDGIPNQGLTVPNEDGTQVKVSLDIRSTWTADESAIMSAVAFSVLAEVNWSKKLLDTIERDGGADTTSETEDLLAGLLIEAMSRLVATGKFNPQVTKIRDFTRTIAGTPTGDRIASTVNISVRNTRIYKGVKIETVEPKLKGRQ
jgi:hypothetical protein